MTHSSSGDPQDNNPKVPDVPASDLPLSPLPAPDRNTNLPELPALPPLPGREGSAENKELSPLPTPDRNTNLPELPALPPQSKREGSAETKELPPLPTPKQTTNLPELPALPPSPTQEGLAENKGLPPLPELSDSSRELPASPEPLNQDAKPQLPPKAEKAEVEEQPAGEAASAAPTVPELTDEQQFILSLSPHEMLTIIEGCAFLPISVAMADGEVDHKEEKVSEAAVEKFFGLFESTDTLANEQFETKFIEKTKEIDSLETFWSKFTASQDEAETEKLVTYFMADFSKVLGKAPESVAQKIKDRIRESCLEVAEASGEGAGANICAAEAAVIQDLLGFLEIELDEETQNRILSSLEQQPEADSTELESQTAVAELEALKPELSPEKEAELKALKDKLSAESETFRYLNGLSEQQRTDFWFGLSIPPGLVAAADGEGDAQEMEVVVSVASDLAEGMVNRIFPENEIEGCDEELLGILLIDLQVKPCFEALEKAVLRNDELVIEGTALERNQRIVDLLEEFKTLLDQAPESLQASLKEWLLESSVKVAEASGSDLEGDDKIGIEERQLLVTLFKELELDYKGTPLEKRLNIDLENQNFRDYVSTLNTEDRIRLMALPYVLVDIVAAADGKIDVQEAVAITAILKEEFKSLDPEFPAVWRENLADAQKFGKGLSSEFQDLPGTKAQFEWVFSLLDDYWKILETMPADLQGRFRPGILKIVTEIAEVSGDGGMAGNIGVEEETMINIICEALGIEREADVTQLEVD